MREIYNVSGGVRFTGNDAQLMFAIFQHNHSIKGFHFVPEAVTPNIYRFTLDAFRNGKPEVLTYDSDRKAAKKKRQ